MTSDDNCALNDPAQTFNVFSVFSYTELFPDMKSLSVGIMLGCDGEHHAFWIHHSHEVPEDERSDDVVWEASCGLLRAQVVGGCDGSCEGYRTERTFQLPV